MQSVESERASLEEQLAAAQVYLLCCYEPAACSRSRVAFLIC